MTFGGLTGKGGLSRGPGGAVLARSYEFLGVHPSLIDGNGGFRLTPLTTGLFHI